MDCAKCYKECKDIYETSDGEYVCQSCYTSMHPDVDVEAYVDESYDRWKDEQYEKKENN